VRDMAKTLSHVLGEFSPESTDVRSADGVLLVFIL
jgi:hypothetical protein